MELKVNKKEVKVEKIMSEKLMKDLQNLTVGAFLNATGGVDVVKTKSMAKYYFSGMPPLFDINDSFPNTDFTPLMCATWVENNKVIKILLDNGAKVIGNNPELPSAIHIAIAKNNQLILEHFLNLEPNTLNHQDKSGTTPLMLAAELKNPDIMKFLLDTGADYHLTNNEGLTALDIAKEKLNTETIAWLRHYMLSEKFEEQKNDNAERSKTSRKKI